jgi:integrase
MSNLVRRANGVFYSRVWQNGRDVWRSLGTRDEAEAREKLASGLPAPLLRQPSAPIPPPVPTAPLFEDATLAWEALVLSQLKREGYRKRLLTSLRQVAPHFEGEPVAALDIPDFTTYVQERLADGCSMSTIKADFTVITGILDAAVLKGWRPYNPLPGALKRVLAYERPLIEPPTRRQVASFARFVGGMLGAFIRFQARTGLRQANGIHLTRSQVDLSRGTLTVTHTKSGVPITIRLNAQVRRMLETLPASPARKGPRYVFWHDDGEPFRNVSSVLRARMLRWAEATGERPFRCHDLRHFFAIRALQNGSMTIYELSRHLGHASVKTTESFYLRWLAEHPDWRA